MSASRPRALGKQSPITPPGVLLSAQKSESEDEADTEASIFNDGRMAEAMATIINSPDNLRFMKGFIEAPCQLAIKYHVMLSASLQTHSVTPCQQTSSKQKNSGTASHQTSS
jgi:hypothetical protein